MKRNTSIAILFLLISLILSFLAARSFLSMHEPDYIKKGKNVTAIRPLSDYFDGIKDAPGDTPVYFIEGENPGATVLILGGTHPDEPASNITAVCLIENVEITQGRMIIIPRANNSGFTCSDPQEGNPQRYIINTPNGKRTFRYGSRITNPVDQWPDPDVYRHYPSGQKLSGSETRNLNRSYPGRPDGSLTEKVAYAIMQLMKKEDVKLAIDLHEASLEYPVVNAIVTHPLAFDIAGEAALYLQMDGLEYNLEQSPENFRGLSHREWGDHLNIPAILLESASTMHGRYHGAKTPEAVITGKDRYYMEAAKHNLLVVEYPEDGIPLKLRVGRHIATIHKILEIWNNNNPGNSIFFLNIPDYKQMQEKGIGAYLF